MTHSNVTELMANANLPDASLGGEALHVQTKVSAEKFILNIQYKVETDFINFCMVPL